MVKQYLHTAIIITVTEQQTLPNGDIVPGSTETDTFKCRLEPASKGGYVKASDGTQVIFSWTIFCGKNTPLIEAGTAIEVQDDAGRTLCIDTVKQFSKGQLNCRIWL